MVVLASVALVSCNEGPTQAPAFEKQVSVVGVLTNQSPQRIYVWYTARPQEPLEFVWNAQVKVAAPFGEVELHARDEVPTEPGGESYMDLGNPLPVHSGLNYRLSVMTSDFHLRGSTTMPGAFSILAPTREDTLRLQARVLTVSLRWNKSAGAHGYVINLIFPRIEYPPGSGIYTRRNLVSYETVDTTFTVSTLAANSGEYIVKVMGYDLNFRRHYFEGLDAVGIEGGYGVFASAWVDSVKFNVKN